MLNTVHNATPHPVTVILENYRRRTIQPCGIIPRVAQKSASRDDDASNLTVLPVMGADIMGEVTGLPPEKAGVWYIVSGMVGAALRGQRHDLLVPGTGPSDSPIREGGRIVAVTRLKRV